MDMVFMVSSDDLFVSWREKAAGWFVVGDLAYSLGGQDSWGLL